MHLRPKIFTTALVALFLFLGMAHAASQPNVIIIMADDVGYSDIGCYGGEIATPNLDALAAGGVRFTQFYNTARCCPTRAALLTGLYPHQAGIGHMMGDYGIEGYRGDLNRRSVTLAEALKPAGYRTYAAGKWHVTPGDTAAALANQKNWPLQRGFDRFYGFMSGETDQWAPYLFEGHKQIFPFADKPGWNLRAVRFEVGPQIDQLTGPFGLDPATSISKNNVETNDRVIVGNVQRDEGIILDHQRGSKCAALAWQRGLPPILALLEHLAHSLMAY